MFKMGKTKLMSFYFVNFIFQSMIFGLIYATPTTKSNVEEAEIVWTALIGLAQRVTILETKQNIYTEDRKRLTRLEMKENIHVENRQRLKSVETKQNLYIEDKQQLLQHFEVITEMIKRQVEANKENDMLKRSLEEMRREEQEMKGNIHELTNTVRELKLVLSTISQQNKENYVNITEAKSSMEEQIIEISAVHNRNNKTLSDMIQRVKNNIEEQIADITETHNQDNKTLSDMVQRLTYDVNNEHMTNQQQTNQHSNLSSTIEEIRTNIQQIESVYQQKINQIYRNQTIQTLYANVSHLQSQESVLGFYGCPQVAFRTSKIKTEDVTGIVKFEKTDLNEGEVYSPSTGKFTAPFAGTYIFTWTIVTCQKMAVASKLVVNGETVARAFSDARDAKFWMDDSASNTVPVIMEKGEEAYININPRWRNHVSGNGLSSFSGWKLAC